MSDSRRELIDKIDAQRKTIRTHIDKYVKFKANGDFTTTAETTIGNSQSNIKSLISKDKSIKASWEDSWEPD